MPAAQWLDREWHSLLLSILYIGLKLHVYTDLADTPFWGVGAARRMKPPAAEEDDEEEEQEKADAAKLPAKAAASSSAAASSTATAEAPRPAAAEG